MTYSDYFRIFMLLPALIIWWVATWFRDLVLEVMTWGSYAGVIPGIFFALCLVAELVVLWAVIYGPKWLGLDL